MEKTLSKTLTRIPEPKSYPVIKHLPHIDRKVPVQSLMTMAREHGSIFRFETSNKNYVVIASHELADEVCDTNRFHKQLPAPLRRIRAFAGDALFTAYNEEPNWALAHRILMPAFSQAAMHHYFDSMLDVGLQLVDKWARLRPEDKVDVSKDMTRLTLDVIALCGFGYRLNSFYDPKMHPFVQAMAEALVEASQLDNRPALVNAAMVRTRRRFEHNRDVMHDLVDGVIQERRRASKENSETPQGKDLLNLMLHAKDPLTGEQLDDENIRNQVVTFLVAGHETTSSLLSFTIHALTQNPEVMAKAVKEVQEAWGGAEKLPSYQDIAKLEYVEQVLQEALRLWPPAPAIVLETKENTVIGGQYEITPRDNLLLLLGSIHRDPKVWDDPEAFNPDRFSKERLKDLPTHAWKPFGNGLRACIGRQFAMLEAKLTMGLILQRFEFDAVAKDKLTIRETLTIKPEDFMVKVRLRDGLTPQDLVHRNPAANTPQSDKAQDAAVPKHGGSIALGFGSNLGSTQALAKQWAQSAELRGYSVDMRPLDAWVDEPLGSYDAFVVFTASYNGAPPDNAAKFLDWIRARKAGELKGLSFSVFGCGHSDWASTFQAIPMAVDAALEKAGATRLGDLGAGDAKFDMMERWESWATQTWPLIDKAADVDIEQAQTPSGSLCRVQLYPSPASLRIPKEAQYFEIMEHKSLVDATQTLPSGKAVRNKIHISLARPPGVSYKAGDHLVVMPENSLEQVQAFAARLGWDLDKVVELQSQGQHPTWPTGVPLTLRTLLTKHVDIQAPASRRTIQVLLGLARCPPEQQMMRAWLDDASKLEADVLKPQLKLIDLLAKAPSVRPDLEALLPSLSPLAPRTYSIASSPKLSPDRIDLTISVLKAPALSGMGEHRGVASTYLNRKKTGEQILALVRAPVPAFDAPSADTPVIFISAGSGFAPMRGFLQEREAQAAKGKVAPTLVFCGCDGEKVDLLYRNEFSNWEASFGAQFIVAESEVGTQQRFVQDKIRTHAQEIESMMADGAKIYLCGDGKHMAPGVRAALIDILGEKPWAEILRQGRYLEDAWIGS